jgi:glycosyltransferase involved in cell wall biosynthesis
MTSKLNFYYPSIERGGLEKNLFSLINSLAAKKYKINFITYENNTKKKQIKEIFYFHKKIKVITSKFFFKFNNRYLKYLFCFVSLVIFCIKKKGLIVSFQGNILAIIAAKLTGCKIIIRCNTAPSKYIDSSYKKIFFKFFYSMSDEILVTSKDFKKEIKKYFNLSSIVHRQSIDSINIKNKSKIKTNFDFFKKFKGLKIINVGRLSPQKDQVTLLKAFSKLIKVKKARLLILGSGKEKQKLDNFIFKEKLNNCVKIISFDSNPFKYIALSDVKVLSSTFEGNPNILLEIACLKKLIISSNCKVGPSEILQQGKGGLLFNVGDYKQLYILLKNLKINEKSIQRKINLSHTYVKKNFKKDISPLFMKIIKNY